MQRKDAKYRREYKKKDNRCWSKKGEKCTNLHSRRTETSRKVIHMDNARQIYIDDFTSKKNYWKRKKNILEKKIVCEKTESNKYELLIEMPIQYIPNNNLTHISYLRLDIS